MYLISYRQWLYIVRFQNPPYLTILTTLTTERSRHLGTNRQNHMTTKDRKWRTPKVQGQEWIRMYWTLSGNKCPSQPILPPLVPRLEKGTSLREYCRWTTDLIVTWQAWWALYVLYMKWRFCLGTKSVEQRHTILNITCWDRLNGYDQDCSFGPLWKWIKTFYSTVWTI